MSLVSRLFATTLRSGRGLLVLLGLLLVVIQVTALWGIVDARQRTEAAALREAERGLEAQAATLESALATLHGDLRYFVGSRPVAEAPRRLGAEDPVARRWSRLDLEGAALLFLEGHSALVRLYVERLNGELLAAVGWREGSPVVLRRDEIIAGPPRREGITETVWALSEGAESSGSVRAWIAPDGLLGQVLPGATGLELGPSSTAREGVRSGDDRVRLSTPVVGSSWSPPIHWELQREVVPAALSGSVVSLVSGLRTTLILNLTILVASVVLGVAVLRQTRRAVAAETELRHREERLELELQLQHSQRLAAIGRLAAGVAHEVNNPLAGIANYVSLLDLDLADGRTESARSHVEQIRHGVDSAAEVVRRVLAFAEPGRRRHGLVDLAAVADRTLGFVASNPQYERLELSSRHDERPVWVEGDAPALAQLILNLLLNACESAPAGGRVELLLDRGVGSARLEVRDDGPGLDPESLDRLFEPFYSGRGSTGLGLAVCHGIVRAHGGVIRGENREAGGARFVVELPLADQAARSGGREIESAEKESAA